MLSWFARVSKSLSKPLCFKAMACAAVWNARISTIAPVDLASSDAKSTLLISTAKRMPITTITTSSSTSVKALLRVSRRLDRSVSQSVSQSVLSLWAVSFENEFLCRIGSCADPLFNYRQEKQTIAKTKSKNPAYHKGKRDKVSKKHIV